MNQPLRDRVNVQGDGRRSKVPVASGMAALVALMLGCGDGAGPSAANATPGGTPAFSATGPAVVRSPSQGGAPAATNVPAANSPTTTPKPAVTPAPAAPPTTPEPGRTATPTTEVTPTRSVAVGEWTYDYYLTANSCGPERGTARLFVTQILAEVTGNDGYISDGETVRMYGFNGGPSIGTATLRWPVISYQVPLHERGGIRAEVTHTYLDARTGHSKVVEVYASVVGTCELTYTG